MKLAEWRKLRGLSQQQLADAIKTSQAAVARFELGHAIPRRQTMSAIVRMSNGLVTPAEFYDLSTERGTERGTGA